MGKFDEDCTCQALLYLCTCAAYPLAQKRDAKIEGDC